MLTAIGPYYVPLVYTNVNLPKIIGPDDSFDMVVSKQTRKRKLSQTPQRAMAKTKSVRKTSITRGRKKSSATSKRKNSASGRRKASPVGRKRSTVSVRRSLPRRASRNIKYTK